VKDMPGSPFTVYFYDGGHSVKDHCRALTHTCQWWADPCVVVVNGWRDPNAIDGTRDGLAVIQDQWRPIQQWELVSRHSGDSARWWNGLFLMVMTCARSG